ncbi:hypothetical protein ABK040_010897 [Willaertia magna]
MQTSPSVKVYSTIYTYKVLKLEASYEQNYSFNKKENLNFLIESLEKLKEQDVTYLTEVGKQELLLSKANNTASKKRQEDSDDENDDLEDNDENDEGEIKKMKQI